MAKRKQDLLLIILLLLLTLFIFKDVLQANEDDLIYGLDLLSLFYPLQDQSFTAFRAGEIPTWNPNLFLGFPQYAEPQLSTFYPPMWLATWLPVGIAYPVLFVLHFFLAAIGLYLLIRLLGGSPMGAFIGGITLTFSGFMLAHVYAGHLAHLMTVAYLPLLLAAAIWAVRKRSWAAAVLAGIPLGLALLAGFAPFYLLLVLAVSCLMIWLAYDSWQRNGWASGVSVIFYLIILGLSAGLLAAIQLLPSAELATFSSRVATANYEFASSGSMPFWNLLTLAMPDLFGATVGSVDYWANLSISAYWEFAIYAGILPLIFFVMAWFYGDKRTYFWIFLGLLGLVIALGPVGGLHRVLTEVVPGFGFFRIPARFGYFFVLSVAVLAGLMFDRWFDQDEETFRFRQKQLRLVMGIGLILLLLTISISVLLLSVQEEKTQSVRLFGVTNQLVRLLILGAASFALLSWRTERRWLLFALFATLLLIDLWGHGRKLVQMGDRYPGFGWIMADTALPAERETYRITSQGLERNMGTLYGFNHVSGYDDFRTGSSMILDQLAATDRRIANLLGIRFYLYNDKQEDKPDESSGWQPLVEQDGVTIYERDGFFPKAFIVHEVIAVADQDESLSLLSQPDLDLNMTAIVQIMPETNCQVESAGPAADRVEFISYAPDRVVLNVNAASAGWLILNDLYYPGWEATVSGQEVTIQPSDYALRGICMPAGSHEVIFQFRPRLLTYGAIASGIGLLLIVIALITLFRTSRRQSTGETSFAQAIHTSDQPE